MRKEPLVFLLIVAFLGWYGKDMFTGGSVRRRKPSATAKDYIGATLPDVSVALPADGRTVDFSRDLFSPPSATAPLPPLVVQLPDLEPLGALAPPTGWGPEPSLFGSLLRRPERPEGAEPIPGLFDLDADGTSFGDEDPEAGLIESADGLSDDPTAREAQIAGLKRQYDWIYTNQFKFGRIQNADRYRLKVADDPEIAFVETDPETGKVLFGGVPVTYDASQYDEFGLVDSALTRVEVGLASFGEPLPPSSFDEALQFADQCLLLRNETPRALEVAEELYRRAQSINSQDDARPRLGLARCYELGFQLEEAFKVYEDLLSSGHDTNAVVHARLGTLLAKLRLGGEAETSFQEALRVERTQWEARLRYGNFLVDEGRIDEALVQLREAVLREPKAPEDRPWRVRARLAQAGALMRAGKADQAFQAFSSAISADVANEVGLVDVGAAGLVTAARFASSSEAEMIVTAAGGGDPADGNFDVLLAAGLLDLDAGRYEGAASSLMLAATADPFRSHEAYRALSRLAEITDNPEEAVTFVNLALEVAPSDPWSLYQRGRLAEQAGDDTEARAAYRAALDVELDLGPVLERMAVIEQAAGRHEAAERYFERALSVEPDRAAVWSRRGWNALQIGDPAKAEEAFREARRLTPSLVSARLGLAWWHYSEGDAAEAATLFGEIIDDRRSMGEGDRPSVFAETQSNRIADHDSKEVWTDRFERAPGRVGNGWTLDQGFGPLAELRDSVVVVSGQQDRKGRTRVFRALPPDRFIAFSCLLTIGSEAKGTRTGLFINSERTTSGGSAQVTSEVSVSRNREGRLEVRVQKSPNDDNANYTTVVGPEWNVGEPIRVSIEKSGDDLEASFTLYVDGEPVATGVDADRLTSSRQAVHFGVFVEGDSGRRADLIMDDVRVVRRK